MMERRDFLQKAALGLTAAGIASALPFDAKAADESVYAAFHRARRHDRRMIGFENGMGDLHLADVSVRGQIPAELSGTLFRNGPGQHERGNERYHHWFDGDGLIQRWEISGGKIGYKARFVGTPKYRAEEAAGQFLYPAGGGGIPARRGVNSPDAINTANTSVLPMGEEVWALWEGGSASRLDAQSLDFKGFVTFANELGGAPFSAHPRKGQDRRIWNIGLYRNMLALYRLKADGSLEQFKIHQVADVGFAHDFILTEKSIVVVLCSTRMGEITPERGMFGAIEPHPELPMQVLVFDRESLEKTRQAQLPAGYIFHFGNGWEEENGTIHFDMAYSENCDLARQIGTLMNGAPVRTPNASVAVSMSANGNITTHNGQLDIEFPRINPMRNTQNARYLYMVKRLFGERSGWNDGLVRADLESGRDVIIPFGPDYMVEEHVFVPRGTAEDDGWLIGTMLNIKAGRTMLNIFDGQHLSDGPVAQASLPLAMPLGFHGQFVRAFS